MKHIPILFSTAMVQAILDGRKTQTRRVVKDKYLVNGDPRFSTRVSNTTGVCPYGQPGDILWVRESWQLVGWDFEDPMMRIKYADGFTMDCDVHDPTGDSMWLLNQVDQLEKKGIIEQDQENPVNYRFTGKKQPFKPNIHMPKSACRIFLKVKSVRVERLQDISEEDAIAEGIERISSGEFSNVKKWGWRFKDYNGYYQGVFPQYSFQSLWQKINGPASWEANPWVWVIEFERVEKSLIIATPEAELTRETGSQVTIIEKA